MWLLGGHAPHAIAQGTTRYVALDGSDLSNTCVYSSTPCRTVQHAVDQAHSGDEVRVVTGVYTGVQARASITQVVYIGKTMAVRGGYTTTNWTTADPESNPTTLDAQGLGRVLVISGTITPTVEGLRITGGDATGLGGDIAGYDAGGGVYVYSATATISGCVIHSNTASTGDEGFGGGLCFVHSDASLIGSTVTSNTASTDDYGHGGGLHVWGGEAVLRDNAVVGNTAGTTDKGDGGGVDLHHSDATLEGNTIANNTASTGGVGLGGGLRLHASDATVVDNAVQGNVGSTVDIGAGGGLHLSDSAAILQGNVVISNTASTALHGAGGGLYLTGSDATLQGNTVRGNIATTASWGHGGGLFISWSDATLQGNAVVNNTAGTASYAFGGGLYLNHSAATVTGNTVASNTASTAGEGRGGGLYLLFSDATLGGNTVVSNTASTASFATGGGLYLYDSDATLSGNMVRGNTASTADFGAGGGLYLLRGMPALTGNVVLSNTATLNPAGVGWGGGLEVCSCDPFTLTNNLVAGNHANSEGGGLRVGGRSWEPASGHLLHTTIADNHGAGQGVYVGQYATLSFTNTIIAGHPQVGITVTAGSTAALEATLWYSNGMRTGGGGTILTGTVNVDGVPAFVDSAAGDYRLGIGSAAIDAGIDAGVTDDMEAHPRLWPYDIGADEYVVTHLRFPFALRNYP
jgi:hypothetical protein